nr:retrovirus-related Pol polyprotein from transposon TNT 1-94 [Tanacetum cinerariifolium]
MGKAKNFQVLQNAWDIISNNGLDGCKDNGDACDRITWITIEGILSVTRSIEAIKTIIKNFGKILEVRRIDFDSKVLSSIKSIVLTTRMNFVCQSLDVMVNGKVYPIRVFEEQFHILSFLRSPSSDSDKFDEGSSCFEEEFIGHTMDEQADDGRDSDKESNEEIFDIKNERVTREMLSKRKRRLCLEKGLVLSGSQTVGLNDNKQSLVKNIIGCDEPVFFGIHESKLEVVGHSLIRYMWPRSYVDWACSSSIGALGDSPNDEEDTRSSHEYINDLEEEYKARALLSKSKRFFKKDTQRFNSAKATDQTECHKCTKNGHFTRECWFSSFISITLTTKTYQSSQHKLELRLTKDFEAKYNKVKAKLALLSSSASASNAITVKNKGLIIETYEWDEEDVSLYDNEEIEVKALMELANEERVFVSKESASNGEWVKISIQKSSASNSNMSITSGNKPRLSEAEDLTLVNHDTVDESLVCSTALPPLEKLRLGKDISKLILSGHEIPDIYFSTYLCARYQANPKESHHSAVRRISRYLKAKALENSKVSFSIPTGGIYGEVRVKSFRNATGIHYLPYSKEYVAPTSIDLDRQWFETIGYGETVSAKGTLKKSLLPFR